MIWKIIAAFRVGIQRLKHPLIRLQSGGWDNDDHQHICIAARLLEDEDLQQVCPIAKDKHKLLELEDECDFCNYLRIVDFNIDAKGKKFLFFHD